MNSVVYVAYPGAYITEKNNIYDITISKVGGKPLYLLNNNEQQTLKVDEKPLNNNEQQTLKVDGKPLNNNEQQTLKVDGKPLNNNEQQTLKVDGKPLSDNEQQTLKVDEKPLNNNEQQTLKVDGKPLNDNEQQTLKVDGKPLSDVQQQQEDMMNVICNVCSNDMMFVLQLYAPLDERYRILYVYMCIHCVKAQVRVFRIVHSCDIEFECVTTNDDEDDDVTVAKPSLDDDWGMNDDTSSDDDADNDMTDKLQELLSIREKSMGTTTVVENVKKLNTAASGTRHPLCDDGFVEYFLELDEEPIVNDGVYSERANELYSAYKNIDEQRDESSSKIKNEEWNEEYEESGDAAFEEFRERTSRCPEQCVRYAYGQKALVVGVPNNEVINECACGSKLEFECQLMPNLLNELCLAKTNKRCGSTVDFLTVCVFTCSASCNENSLVEEHCTVYCDDAQ